MPPPVPPQGNQQLVVAKPQKVYAEQYLVGQPLPIGVVTAAFPPVFAEGDPRVYTQDGRVLIPKDTDWILTHRYSGQVSDVLSAEEYADRFGAPTAEGQPA
jgi:hypothetical protein